MTRLTLILAALLAACSPATTRRLCDTSEIVLDVARPETPRGELAAQVARLIRGMFCPVPVLTCDGSGRQRITDPNKPAQERPTMSAVSETVAPNPYRDTIEDIHRRLQRTPYNRPDNLRGTVENLLTAIAVRDTEIANLRWELEQRKHPVADKTVDGSAEALEYLRVHGVPKSKNG